MTGFLPLIAMLAAFIAIHMALSRPAIRDTLVARIGRGGYGALHGAVSLAGLAAVFWGFWQAPYVELWPPLAAFRATPPLVMPVACILFIAGMTTPCAGLRGDRLPGAAIRPPASSASPAIPFPGR